MDKERWNTVVIFVFGLLLTLIFFLKVIPKTDQTSINAITVLGTYISIFGLVVAYIQISSVKKIAKYTELKIRETRDRITLILSVSDLSRGIKIAEEAQIFLNTANYSSALLRLKDLKSIVIQAEMISDFKNFHSRTDYKDLKSSLFDDINNLSDFSHSHKKKINFSVINSDLEKISSVLIEFENHLKSSQ